MALHQMRVCFHLLVDELRTNNDTMSPIDDTQADSLQMLQIDINEMVN
jgi:hypothetical protein